MWRKTFNFPRQRSCHELKCGWKIQRGPSLHDPVCWWSDGRPTPCCSRRCKQSANDRSTHRGCQNYISFELTAAACVDLAKLRGPPWSCACQGGRADRQLDGVPRKLTAEITGSASRRPTIVGASWAAPSRSVETRTTSSECAVLPAVRNRRTRRALVSRATTTFERASTCSACLTR